MSAHKYREGKRRPRSKVPPGEASSHGRLQRDKRVARSVCTPSCCTPLRRTTSILKGARAPVPSHVSVLGWLLMFFPCLLRPFRNNAQRCVYTMGRAEKPEQEEESGGPTRSRGKAKRCSRSRGSVAPDGKTLPATRRLPWSPPLPFHQIRFL